MFEKILIPLDGSRSSGRAIPYAKEIAERFNSEVTLLQVVRPTPLIVPAAGNAIVSPTAVEILEQSTEDQDKKNISKANRYLKRKLKEVTAGKIEGSRLSIIGDPAKTIIDYCKKKSINLVVMTTSGKSGLRRTFLGSVADKVVRESGLPVLVIRPGKR